MKRPRSESFAAQSDSKLSNDSHTSASKPFWQLASAIPDVKDQSQLGASVCIPLNSISKHIWNVNCLNEVCIRYFTGHIPEFWRSRAEVDLFPSRLGPDFGCFRAYKKDFAKSVSDVPNLLPWPLIDGAGETEVIPTEEGLQRAVHSTRINLEQRPDGPSALGIYATKAGYVLVRVNSVRLLTTNDGCPRME